MDVVVDEADKSRFAVIIDGHVAELLYQRGNDTLELHHTGVPDELEGRGIGGALIRAAVDDARARGLIVVPYCPFAMEWLRRHPDVTETIQIEWPSDDDRGASDDHA